MGRRTYYDILGVSADATAHEIACAKNALAKIYHPDVNIKNNIDTTRYMQEILEAYRVLSDEGKRKKYDMKLSGRKERTFCTYTVTPPEEEPPVSFVSYWNAAYKLNDIVEKSGALLRQRPGMKSLPSGILKISGRQAKIVRQSEERLKALALAALNCMAVLKSSGIPAIYWHPDAMNWVLVRWGGRQAADYRILFSKYDVFIENNKTRAEKIRLKNRSRHFRKALRRLLEYSI